MFSIIFIDDSMAQRLYEQKFCQKQKATNFQIHSTLFTLHLFQIILFVGTGTEPQNLTLKPVGVAERTSF